MVETGPRAMGFAVVGLIALIVAGRLIVVAAKGIGGALGLDPFVVGATLVALGTSSPELATAIISRRRGHSDVGAGTVLGRNGATGPQGMARAPEDRGTRSQQPELAGCDSQLTGFTLVVSGAAASPRRCLLR